MKPKTVVCLLVAMLTLMAVAWAGTAATMNKPVASGRFITATSVINVSVGAAAKNCSLTFTSAKTGDSQVYIIYNDTAASIYCRGNGNSKLLFDSNDYVVTGTCYNYTASAPARTVTSITGVIVDNTKPSCAFSGLTEGATYQFTKDLTVNAVNATSCSVWVGKQLLTPIEASDVFSYTPNLPVVASGVLIEGQSTDGTNTTDCASYRINIEDEATRSGVNLVIATASGQAAGQAVAQQQTQQKRTTSTLVIAAIAIGAWLYYRKKR